MYFKHYHLTRKPFGLTPGPDFFWLSNKHKEALATLRYGILGDLGFLLLTGEVGVGKTALIHRLLSSLDSSTIVAHITDPGLGINDFFKLLAVEFGIETPFASKGEFLILLERFLRQANEEQKKVLLIVDEAQRINSVLLDQIRVLSNIELDDQKLINIFLIGQPEFKNTLLESANRPIRQRIAINYHVKPLDEAETGQYIEHRLKVAGAEQEIFKPDAMSEIYRISQGYPRAINILCDHALLTGYASGKQTIDVKIIRECETELNIEADFAFLSQPSSPKKPPRKSAGGNAETERSPEPVPPPPAQQSKAWYYPAVIGIAIFLVALAGYYFLWPGPGQSPSIQEAAGPIHSRPAPTDRALPPSPDAGTQPALNDAGLDHSDESGRGQNRVEAEPSAEVGSAAPALAASAPPPPIRNETDPAAPVLAVPTPPPSIGNEAAQSAPEAMLNAGQNQAENEPPAEADPAAPALAVSAVPPPVSPGTPKAAPADTIPPLASVNTSAVSSKPASAPVPAVEPKTGQQNTGDVPANDQAGESVQQPPPPTVPPKSPRPAPVAEPTIADQASAVGSSAPETGAQASTIEPDRASPPGETTPQQGTGLGPEATGTTSENALPATPPAVAPAIPAIASVQPQTIESGPAATEKPESDDTLENRLRSFLQDYCSTYASKNLDSFSGFFAPNALENGKSFESLLPKYQRNFTFINTIYYRIELQQVTREENGELLEIDGDFFLRWLPPDNKWRENAGNISMTLEENGSSFLVHRLDYRGNRSN